jgi:hypothetical protein
VKTTGFRTPGEGSSLAISVLTVAVLFALWFVATNLGWIRPLFLPTPQSVFQQFHEYLLGLANDKPLLEHLAASISTSPASRRSPCRRAPGCARPRRSSCTPPTRWARATGR